ncbi:hypothetical protein BpHYR1_007043 [Brachionus plicatilis]|uniref:Uncharacterized protein n=1 Tax=Brachionus plicatilis TaxID=10195 RepID=A0A3M7SLH0_BRAPC|nr:hypothetical protein BpHYR1_007043 [Brachionus plicatilis]
MVSMEHPTIKARVIKCGIKEKACWQMTIYLLAIETINQKMVDIPLIGCVYTIMPPKRITQQLPQDLTDHSSNSSGNNSDNLPSSQIRINLSNFFSKNVTTFYLNIRKLMFNIKQPLSLKNCKKST